MREVLTMWRDIRMVSLTFVIAAIYLAGLIPSKGLVIVPGFTEVRPGSALPVAFGLMFGPAAAWGSAIGNLLGDAFGGTLSMASAYGFVGNFFMGFVGYKLWGNLGPLSSGEEPTMQSARSVLEYLLIAFVAAVGTASIIAWGLDTLGVFPFSVFATIIAVNNFLAAASIGLPLLYLLYGRASDVGVTYAVVMDSEDEPAVPPARSRRTAWGIVVVSISWFVLGVLFSLAFEGVPFGAIPAIDVTAGTGGSPVQIALGMVAFVALFALAVLTDDRLPSLASR